MVLYQPILDNIKLIFIGGPKSRYITDILNLVYHRLMDRTHEGGEGGEKEAITIVSFRGHQESCTSE